MRHGHGPHLCGPIGSCMHDPPAGACAGWDDLEIVL
jgi:hypothetical protein